MTLQTPSSSPALAASHRSPWNSPVPYLFGGLAVILGLIAFALLMLACSYLKFSDHLDTTADDLESGNGDRDSKPHNNNNNNNKGIPAFEDKYFVIMAGETKPTFLATPISSRPSSYVCSSCRSTTLPEVEMMEEKERDTL